MNMPHESLNFATQFRNLGLVEWVIDSYCYKREVCV